MQNITDRELLAFCSLANLKLEFSQSSEKKKDSKGKETTTYKTIRQLIDLELAGQKVRKEESYDREKEFSDKKAHIEKEKKAIPADEEALNLRIENSKQDNGMKKEEYDEIGRIRKTIEERKIINKEEDEKYNEEYPAYRNYMMTSANTGKLGTIYRIHKSKETKFYYKSKEEINEKSPMLMECFDCKKNPQNKFLEEWEIFYTGDSYTLSANLFENFIETSAFKEIIKKINPNEDDEIEIDKAPHRDDVESGKDKFKKRKLTTSTADMFVNGLITFGSEAVAEKVG